MARRLLVLLVALLGLGACDGGSGPPDAAGSVADAADTRAADPDGHPTPRDVAPPGRDAPDGPPADATPAPDAARDGGAALEAVGPTPDAGRLADTDEALDASPDAVAPADAAPAWDAAAGPPSVVVTVNEIPAAMNGSTPYLGPEHPDTAFRLRLPTARFTVDVEAAPAPGGAPVDWSTLVVTATLVPAAGGPTEELDLAPRLALAPPRATWQVPEAAPLPEGQLTLTASVADVAGQRAAPSTLTVDLAPLPAHLDPFPAPDPWLVVLSRDEFALELVRRADGTYDVLATRVEGGNGVPDFDEAFAALGLLSSDPTARAIVRARLVARIRAVTNRIFLLDEDGAIGPDSVPVALFFEGDPGAPDPATFAAGGFSMIAVGGDGDPEDMAGRVLGRSRIDPNNQREENDAVYGLGIFTTQLVRIALGMPIGALFLRDLSPLDGTPIGLDPRDAVMLAEGFDPTSSTDAVLRRRYDLLTLLIDFGGLGTASLLCHEMGHSLGLVPPGVPPVGLFGGVPGLPFVENDMDDWHIDTPGLNVEQNGAVTNPLEALAEEPRFNALSLAYLRRRLVVDPWAAKARPLVPATLPTRWTGPPASTAPVVRRVPVADVL